MGKRADRYFFISVSWSTAAAFLSAFSRKKRSSSSVPAAHGSGTHRDAAGGFADPRARRPSVAMSGRASVTQLALPTGIKKLTNIAVVRLKKAGVRFEIACYKNTVVAWRDGFEKDLDNVLQTTKVYNNVSKGVFAKEEDLLRAFGTKDEEKVSLLILTDGELQVSEKERKNVFDTIFRDAVTVLVEKCVNPSTNRPYPPGMIERALREIHFSVDPMRSAKQQALAAIPKLRAIFPIKRAAMRFKFVVGHEWFDKTIQFLESGAVLDAVVERATKNTNNSESEIVCVADPSAYRLCDAYARDETGKTGRLEVVTVAVTEGGVSSGAFESSSGVSGVHEASSSGGVLLAKTDKSNERNEELGPSSDAIREVARDVRVLDLDAGVGDGGGADRRRASRASSLVAGAAPRSERGVELEAGAGVEVLYARGKIADLPESYASRRERFAPLDDIQDGWTVELRRRAGSSVVDAVFFDPDGVGYKAFADARREALKSKKR